MEGLIPVIVMAVIVVGLVIGLFALIGPALGGATNQIVDCIHCAMDPDCTSCS